MTTLTLKWKRCGDHTLPMPQRAHADDAGLDLPVVDPPDSVRTGSTIIFRTGWAVEIPTGWYGQIVVRSSIGKAGWDLESSGVVDSGFRGEVLLPMCFRGFGAARVEHGQRMAQMILLPVPRVECIEVESLSDTPRGQGGFGSSGR